MAVGESNFDRKVTNFGGLGLGFLGYVSGCGTPRDTLIGLFGSGSVPLRQALLELNWLEDVRVR